MEIRSFLAFELPPEIKETLSHISQEMRKTSLDVRWVKAGKILKPFGIKEEKRPFRPHLTIGRFRKGAKPGTHLVDFLFKYQDLTSPVCTLKELVLFKSDLKQGGAVYSELKAWPLIGES